ncbi:MAG TPA: DUF2115 domain-containing protein [Methanocorpusculum sp.]|nr:DUF2115 domain-containing protein [Methanocorpusculum sp.]
MDIFAFRKAELKEFISTTAQALEKTTSPPEAIQIISSVLQKYTIFDLQKIGAHILLEVEKLPDPYRKKYRPYSGDLLNRFHEFISAKNSGAAVKQIRDTALWKTYWAEAAKACFSDEVSQNDPRPELTGPAGKFFYRLIYGYTMLIADKPGHPVGMPFPGGWTVREKDGKILCPIRDKEKDLPQALCNFCPAVQDPDCK